MKLKEKFNKKDGQNKKEKKPLKQRIKESMNGKISEKTVPIVL